MEGPGQKDWMTELSRHFTRMRREHPDDRLLIMFDIDGTIIDTRYMTLYVLKAYDRCHGTSLFDDLGLEDIDVHENEMDRLLACRGLSEGEAGRVLGWYDDHRCSRKYVLRSHRPYKGVLEVIRWFQIQPETYIGINSGRPVSLMEDTLRSLNQLGREFKVEFTEDMVHLNPCEWGSDITMAKVAGLEYFRERGYRVFAYIDNEPANLEAVSRVDQDILLLHADTLFESRRSLLPPGTAKGREYGLHALMVEECLPKHINFIWKGIEDGAGLESFIASGVSWGECDVHSDSLTGEPVLRRDALGLLPWGRGCLSLPSLLRRMEEEDRGLVLDMKEGGRTMEKVLWMVDSFGLEDGRLCFKGDVQVLGEEGFRRLAEVHPQALLQCRIGFLAPLVRDAPSKVREILEMFEGWGVNRFSMDWRTRDKLPLMDALAAWGYQIDLSAIPDTEAFFQAVLCLPDSITWGMEHPFGTVRRE